jgi:protein-tyrosine phosphatase
MKRKVLNLRDLGGIPLQDGKGQTPHGLYLRSGKLSKLTPEECKKLCQEYHIACVVDLRTPIEAQEFPDPLPDGVEYKLISLLKDATIGITHETGSDPMTIIRSLRKQPEKLKEMTPDFASLYELAVTDEYSLGQLDQIVTLLRKNAAEGKCTLFHCTAGKDRTGIASMALLKSYGVSDEDIVRDFMRTNRNAFWPTIMKCIGVLLLTHNWDLVKICYTSFMAQRELIETAIRKYVPNSSF